VEASVATLTFMCGIMCVIGSGKRLNFLGEIFVESKIASFHPRE